MTLSRHLRCGNKMKDRQLFEEITYCYSEKLRTPFKEGKLAREWHRRYPWLFTKQDLGLTEVGSSFLFFEWLGMVLLHESTGYTSYHKFNCKNHCEAYALFEGFVGRKFADDFYEDSSGSPDLLVVAPDRSDWFFCEAKRPKDKIGPRQRKIARMLLKHTNRKVAVLTLRPVTRLGYLD